MTPEASLNSAPDFAAIVGGANVRDDAATRAFYSHDISGPAPVMPEAVVAPATIEELSAVVAAATSRGAAVYPRGGGLSYTGGYTPSRAPAIMLDLRRLDRVAAIDEGAVTVEAGCTWGRLYEALDARGRRVPSFGPLSGHGATVGGTASTDGGFFGTANYGSVGEHVVGIEAVAADGRVIAGGADTALFIGDCGALGVKARVKLRTIPQPAATLYASFAFAESRPLAKALASLRGQPGIGEAFGFDPTSHRNLVRSGFSVLESAAIAGDLLRVRGTWFDKIGGLLRTARAGKAFVNDLAYSLHLAIDGESEAEAEKSRTAATRIVASAGGELIPDVIPRVTRSRPFRPVKQFLGPGGENWVPVHGILPADAAADAIAACEAHRAERQAAMDDHAVSMTILTVLMRDRIIVEPQLFWPDRLSPFHLGAAAPDQLKSYTGLRPRPAARAVAHALRDELRDVLDRFGAAHFQIGRYYRDTSPLRARRRAKKAELDPNGLVNPGVLGL
jgi:FAD/FMN-containing dehydrogenase